MKIIFPGLGNKIAGPESWVKTHTNELMNKCEVIQFNSMNLIEILTSIYELSSSDILHTYNQSPGSVLYLILSKLFKNKSIHTVHGDFYIESENKKGLKKIFWMPLNKMCLSLANKITFPSKYLYKEIIKKNPDLKKKSIIIPNGINFNSIKKISSYPRKRLGLKNKDIMVLEVTSFNLKQKASGINLLIKDFLKFKKINKNSYLFIIGGGKLLQSYRDKYQSKNIKFLGFRKDALRFIKACDLFVHYSNLENFPIVLLEAMCCKKSIRAIFAGGIKEFLPSECNRVNGFPKIIKNEVNYNIDEYSSKNISNKFYHEYLT